MYRKSCVPDCQLCCDSLAVTIMALPETNNDIQFRELKKSTGKITLQLVINGRVFWKRLDAAPVDKKDTTSRKYICSNFSNNHNHDINEEVSLVKAAHRSLKS